METMGGCSVRWEGREFRVLEAKGRACEEKGVSLCRMLLVVKEGWPAE